MVKEIKDVETIWDFEKFLVELAKKQPVFYAPLSMRYQILLSKHKFFLRIWGIVCFLLGFLAGLYLGFMWR